MQNVFIETLEDLSGGSTALELQGPDRSHRSGARHEQEGPVGVVHHREARHQCQRRRCCWSTKSVKFPKVAREVSVFFADGQNRLSRNDPRQPKLFDPGPPAPRLRPSHRQPCHRRDCRMTPDPNSAATILEVGKSLERKPAVIETPVGPVSRHAGRLRNGEPEEYKPAPRFLTQAVLVDTPDSFVRYVSLFAGTDRRPVVFADLKQPETARTVAVLDYHGGRISPRGIVTPSRCRSSSDATSRSGWRRTRRR